MLGLHVFLQTGPPQRVDFLAPPSVCYIKTEAFRKVPCPRTQQASLPACSTHYSFSMLSAKQESCEYHFLKSFGMTRQGKWTPGLPTAKRTLSPLHHRAPFQLHQVVEKSLLTTTQITFPVPRNLLVSGALHNYLWLANNSTKANAKVVWKLRKYSKSPKAQINDRLCHWITYAFWLSKQQEIVHHQQN